MKEGFLTNSNATRKTTRFLVRDAKCNAADAMHRASMDAPDGQSNWPGMRNTSGKPGFFSGEDRKQTFERFPNVLRGVRKVQIYVSFKRTTKQLLGLVRVNTLTFKDLDVTINSAAKRKIE
jgi:hypothetical protein